MFEAISQLTNIKSRLREDIETYLRETRISLNKIEWRFDGEPLKVDDLHIEQFVITKKIKGLPHDFEGEKRGTRNNSAIPSTLVEITQQNKLYELDSSASHFEQMRWSQVVSKKNLRTVIIGAPGSGKSFTTKYTIIERIDSALNKLTDKTVPLEAIEIPIWLTARQLAEQNIANTADALLMIIHHSVEKYNLSEIFADSLRKKLERVFYPSSSKNGFSDSAAFYIVVDSLDELPADKKDPFKKLAQHLDKSSILLIVTCRTLQWEERSNWLGFTPTETVELAPLKFHQQTEFARRFFKNREVLQHSMRRCIDGNYALRHAFTTPLLLTFGCLLHGDNSITELTTYIQIYGLVVRKIFNGDWRVEKPYWTIEGVAGSQQYLNFLNKICWEIFEKNPETNLFTLDDWNEACERSKKNLAEQVIHETRFLDALVDLGFISEAGYNEQTDKQWSFAHRTLLEFSAARTLAKRRDWLEIARRHFWFAPEWLECLTFMAGLLDEQNARKLISAVRDEEDDIFGSMIVLEAKFVGASRFFRIEDIKLICDQIFYGLSQAYYEISKNIKLDYNKPDQILSRKTIYPLFLEPSLRTLKLNAACKKYIYDRLINPLFYIQIDISDNEKFNILLILLRLGEVDENLIEAVIHLFSNKSISDWDLDQAIFILGKLVINDERVINTLVSILLDDSLGDRIRSRAIITLSKSIKIDDLILDYLVSLFNDEYRIHFHSHIAIALERHGRLDDRIVKILLSILLNPNYSNMLRIDVAQTLGALDKVNDSVIIKSLINVFFDSSNDILLRIESIKSLTKLKNIEADLITALFSAFNDASNNFWLRVEVAYALVELGQTNEEIVNFLYSLLPKTAEISRYSSDLNEIFFNTAFALGRLGKTDELVINFLIDLLLREENIFRLWQDEITVKLHWLHDPALFDITILIQTGHMTCAALALSIISTNNDLEDVQVEEIMKAILVNFVNKLGENQFVLREFSTPLLQISQSKKIKITWNLSSLKTAIH